MYTYGQIETKIELIYIPEGKQFEGKGMFIFFEMDR